MINKCIALSVLVSTLVTASADCRLQVGETTIFDASREAFGLPADNLNPRDFAKFFSGDTLFNTTWVNASSVVDGRDGLGPLIKQAILLVMPYQGRQRGATKFRRSIGRLSNSCQFDGTGFQRSPKPHPIYGNQISARTLPEAKPEARVTIEYGHINGTDLASLGFAKEHPQLKNMDH